LCAPWTARPQAARQRSLRLGNFIQLQDELFSLAPFRVPHRLAWQRLKAVIRLVGAAEQSKAVESSLAPRTPNWSGSNDNRIRLMTEFGHPRRNPRQPKRQLKH